MRRLAPAVYTKGDNMPIEVACPGCEAPIKAPEKLAGKVIKCPRCQERIVLPELEPSPEPEPQPESEEAGAGSDAQADAAKTKGKGVAKEPAAQAMAPTAAPTTITRPFRISVLDGFRLGIGLGLASVLAYGIYLGGFWGASRFSQSVRKQWEEKVDSAIATTMGGDITMPNDPLPDLPSEIRSLYRQLGLYTVRVAQRKGTLHAAEARRLIGLLSGRRA